MGTCKVHCGEIDAICQEADYDNRRDQFLRASTQALGRDIAIEQSQYDAQCSDMIRIMDEIE
jgi:hypothetical protein